MAGVAIACAAMIIVMSVFNGFHDFTAGKISQLSPQLLVTPAQGKIIANADSLAVAIDKIEGVDRAAVVVEERAFAIAGDQQAPIVIKGIDPQGSTAHALKPLIIDGISLISEPVDSGFTSFATPAIASVGVANALFTFPSSPINITIYEPRRKARLNPANPMSAFRADSCVVTAVYRTEQADFDKDYLIVPLQFARKILSYTTQGTAVEISLRADADALLIAEQIKALGGGQYNVADPIGQQQEAFRMINVEKWLTIVMLSFILIIAAFNILSTLSILIIDKRPNHAILAAMGATDRTIASIYSKLAMLVTLIGGFVGIIIGLILALLQQCFGFIKLYADDPTALAIEAYPVSVNPVDVLLVIVIITVVGLVSAWVTRHLKH